jgi:hypothetical protein
MMQLWLGLLAYTSLAAGSDDPSGVSDRSSQRIQAVVDTLGDLLKSIENEEEEEGKNFKCFENWCDKELSSVSQHIDDAQLKIEDLKVSLDQFQSTIDRNDFAVKKGKEEAEDIENGIQQATSIREEENEKYQRDRQMNQQSVQQLGEAIAIVKKANAVGFLQGEEKLQISAPGESSFVLGVFESLEKNLKRNGAKADEIEMKKKTMYDNLHAGKSQQLGLVQGDIRTKNMLISEAKQKLVDSQNDLTSTQDALTAAEDGKEDTGADCETKKREFALKTEDRQKEKAAIREAMSYLSLSSAESGSSLVAAKSTPVSFVQLTLGKSLSSLTSLSQDLGSLAEQVGTTAKADHFENVKKVIQDLIGVLNQEQADEKDKRDWCEDETAKTEHINDTKTDELERTNASIAKGESLIGQLTTESDALNASIDEAQRSKDEAAGLRKDAKALYERGTKDRQLALKVLTEATTVLEKFYASQAPALVEVSDDGPKPNVKSAKRHSGESNVVLAMLAKITDDIKLEQKHAQEEEDKAAADFEKYVLDVRHNFDATMMEITEKVTRRAKLAVKLEASVDDQESTMDSLAALGTKMEATSSECKDLVENYEKREKARKFEVDQLKDAFEILSGSQIAARTAFLSAEKSFLQQRTSDTVLRQLQGVSRSVAKLIQAATL